MNKHLITAAITAYQPILLTETDPAAAVIIFIMFDEDENLFLILTKRTNSLAYPGDYCFPGGRHEISDLDLKMTGLREVKEELNLDAEHFKLLGQLDDFDDRYGNLVRPFVALISQKDFETYAENASEEISSVCYFPMSALSAIEVDPALELITKRHPSYRYSRDDVTVWGLTASIMVHLGNILFGLNKEVGKKVK